MTPHELREVAAGYFFLPSPCLAPVVGCQIILPSTEHNPVIVDLYGDALMNLPAPGDAHWRVQHDAIADAFRDHCVHDLGIAVRREVDDLFQQAVPLGNTVPRDELKDLVPDAELSLPAFNVVTGSYDPRSLKSTLLEFKTMRYGVKYTSVPRATAVDRFERSLLGDIQRGLAARDAAWHNTEPGHKGPLRDILDMSEYTGMVFGTVGAAPAIAADEEAISDEETRRAIMLASNVVPALSVEQYKAAISRARADAWPQIRGDIEEENFDQLSNSLLFGSFDEVKQSSFYLPWALLEKDVGAAVRARDAYMRLSDAIDNFSTAAAEGAKLNFSTEQVRSAFDDVDSALDVFLSASASA
eukprot:jgi/Tetstr1/460234/TSEL_005549.t1